MSADIPCVLTHTILLLYELNQLLQNFIQNPADKNTETRQDELARVISCWQRAFGPEEQQSFVKTEVKSQTRIFKLAYVVYSHTHTHTQLQ